MPECWQWLTPVKSTTTTYLGDYYEWTGSASTSKKYYYIGGQRVAMQVGTARKFLLDDHLRSMAITTDGAGIKLGKYATCRGVKSASFGAILSQLSSSPDNGMKQG